MYHLSGNMHMYTGNSVLDIPVGVYKLNTSLAWLIVLSDKHINIHGAICINGEERKHITIYPLNQSIKQCWNITPIYSIPDEVMKEFSTDWLEAATTPVMYLQMKALKANSV